MEVLCTKHPDACPLYSARLDSYTCQPLELVPAEITSETVTEILGHLSGVSRPRGMDLVSLQHWLLRFRSASGEFRMTVAGFAE